MEKLLIRNIIALNFELNEGIVISEEIRMIE
jgi:hypothetical protein